MHWFDFSLLLLLSLIDDVIPERTCTIREGECTYNIHLSYPPKGCTGEKLLPQMPADVILNDNGVRIHDVQKHLKAVKEEHEIRLKNLENEILKRTSDSEENYRRGRYRNSPAADLISSDSKFLSSRLKEEPDLLKSLQAEFNELRESLNRKNVEIFSMKKKLNDTSSELTKTQAKLFDSTRQLITTEDKLAQLTHERHVLKNQVKDRDERLSILSEELNDTATDVQDLQEEYYKVVRSESNIKEELYYYKIKLNETLDDLRELNSKHRGLKNRHHQVKYELRVRERELIMCYRAKTHTFCGFEHSNECGFTQENSTDFFNWERVMGKTPSSGTGPTADHTCGSVNGHFMYVEASAKGRGNNAVMYSPRYRGLTEQCIEFFYHMFGRHIGTLNVYTKTPSDELLSVWRAFGNQGNIWIPARLSVPRELARASYQIAFEAIAVNGYQGDIAIDDVRVVDGPCPVDEKVRPVTIHIEKLKTNLTSYETILRRRRKHKNRNKKNSSTN